MVNIFLKCLILGNQSHGWESHGGGGLGMKKLNVLSSISCCMVIIRSILWHCQASFSFAGPTNICLQLCLAGWYCSGCCHTTWLNHTSLFLLIAGIDRRGSYVPNWDWMKLRTCSFVLCSLYMWNSFHRHLISNVCSLLFDSVSNVHG